MKKYKIHTKSKFRLNCKEATFLTELSKEGKLSMALKIRLWYHLSVCPPCKRFKKQTLLLAKKLSQLGSSPKQFLEDLEKEQLQKKIEQALQHKGKSNR